jgi:hypothetical protein
MLLKKIGRLVASLRALLFVVPRLSGIWCTILFLLLEPAPSLQAQSADVPLHHAVYFLLERLAVMSPHRALDLHVVPVKRAQVLQILQEAEALSLSKADAALVRQYLAEFTDPPVGESAPSGAERHVLRYEEGQAQIFADLYGIQRFEFQRGQGDSSEANISRTRVGGRLRAQLPPRLLVAVDFSNALERGTKDSLENFDPGSGGPVTVSGSSAFRETAIAYARFDLHWFELEAGRNQFSWNLSPFTQLTLLRSNQPFNLIRPDASWRKFRFIFAHTRLRSEQEKYLAAHRVEIQPWRNFLFGIGETVIYGNRSAEFAYLNPFMLYHVAEHLLGDKDNNVLTLDFSYFPWQRTKFYGEIYIDDLSLEYPLGTYYGNKLAWLAGIFWYQPFGWQTADARVEYSRIDPFVYTHYKPENVYEQDGEGLGARFGPNADRVLVHLGWQPHRDFRLAAQFRYQRKGKGDIFTPHQESDGFSKGFLKGTNIKTSIIHLKSKISCGAIVYSRGLN